MDTQQQKLALRRELELKLARLNVDFLSDDPKHNIKAYVTKIIDLVECSEGLSIDITEINDFPKADDHIFINILYGNVIERPSSGTWLDSEEIDSKGRHLYQQNCLLKTLLVEDYLYESK